MGKELAKRGDPGGNEENTVEKPRKYFVAGFLDLHGNPFKAIYPTPTTT